MKGERREGREGKERQGRGEEGKGEEGRQGKGRQYVSLPQVPKDLATPLSNCRTIQTKFHLDNQFSTWKHLHFPLKTFKLCYWEISLISFHFCFNQKTGTSAVPRKPL
jgi:hypothetical protein